jgi:hypothetical protein
MGDLAFGVLEQHGGSEDELSGPKLKGFKLGRKAPPSKKRGSSMEFAG